MKKNKLMALGCGILLSVSAYTANAAGSIDQLMVINNWNQAVEVREGFFFSKKANVKPGDILRWTMLSGLISRLSIRYQDQNIAGCPSGNYGHGLKVKIMQSYTDANKPRCEIDI